MSLENTDLRLFVNEVFRFTFLDICVGLSPTLRKLLGGAEVRVTPVWG